MEDKSGKWTIGERIAAVSGTVLVAIALFTFVFILPSTLNSVARIVQLGTQVTGINGFSLTPGLIYLTASIALALALISLLSLFVNRNSISKSFSRDSTRKFFGFLMIYILLQLILTEIFAYAMPNIASLFPFHENLGVQNFVFAFLSLEQSVIFVFVPVSVALTIIAVLRGESISRYLRFYEGSRTQVLIISLGISLFSTLFISGSVLGYVSNFVSFTLLNIIFLRFGFLKAFLTNFSLSMTNVTATLIAGNLTLSAMLPLFLFFLGFLGVYSLLQVSVPSQKEGSREEMEEKPPKVEASKRPQIEPFIYSRCPQCGNAVFHVIPSDMSLKCEKCEHVLQSDAKGPRNISIEIGKASRT